MMKYFRNLFPYTILMLGMVWAIPHSEAQFVLNGNAVSLGGDCYRLTTNTTWQVGSIFSTSTINLNQDFSTDALLYFGNMDGNGADGITFVFTTTNTALGTGGQGIGYQGITPSLVVEMDDWQNGNYADPAADHLAIMRNGNPNHSSGDNLSGPTNLPNVEDGQEHCFSLEWDASTQTLTATLDGESESYTGNIVASIFGGNPNVYWGYTASTGGSTNVHRVCIGSGTPTITPMSDVTICEGESVMLQADPNGISYDWDFDPTLSATNISNPVATPTTTTTYEVTIEFACGTVTDDVVVTVIPKPDVTLSANDPVCEGQTLELMATGGNSYAWSGPAGFSSNLQNPVIPNVGPANAGTYSVTVTDANDCESTETLDVLIAELPDIFVDPIPMLCTNDPVYTTSVDPTGGTWTGSVNPFGEIDPSTLGQGNFTATYSFTNSDGCTDSVNISFMIGLPPAVSIVPVGPLCENDDPIFLTGNPSGGNWGGFAGGSGDFDPSINGSGTFSVSYEYTAPSGCANIAYLDIVVNPAPSASLDPAGPFCEDDPPTNLNGSPSGGVWSGPVSSSGLFSPNLAGVGNHAISYTTSNSFGCSATEEINVEVFALPNAVIDPIPPICESDGTIQASASPPGGIWSGDVSPDGAIDPVALGPGNYTAIYFFDDANGCSDGDTVSFTVLPSPAVTLNPVGPFCEKDNPVTLTASPAGGTWGGVVNSPVFNPRIIGPGTWDVTYTYINASGCEAEEQIFVEVFASPEPTIEDPGIICQMDPVLTLSEDPPGGTWGGVADNQGQINPSQLTVGNHLVTYAFTDGNGCSDTAELVLTVAALPVVTILPQAPLCENDPVTFLTGTPAGGNWFGDVGPNGDIDPPLLGFGNFTAFYEYTDGNGCFADTSITFEIREAPVITFDQPDPFCLTPGIQQLNITPSGGTWTGDVNASGQFNPIILGTGSYQASYTVTNANGCTSWEAVDFEIIEPPIIDFLNTGPFCLKDTNIVLEAIPDGGDWSGAVNTLGEFNPLVLGQGSFSAQYLYEDPYGCTYTDSVSFTILNADTVQYIGSTIFCPGQAPVQLNALPANGVWSGPGISPTGLFSPASLNPGIYAITYALGQQSNGCFISKTIPIEILAPPAMTITGDTSFCTTSGTQQFQGTPVSGNWLGAADSLGRIDPLLLGPGTFSVEYQIAYGPGCQSTTSRNIRILPPPTAVLSGSGSLCAGGNSQTDLNINLTGSGPWIIRYAIDSAAQLPIATAQNPFTLTTNQPGIYSLISIEDSTGCRNSGSGQATVFEIPPLGVQNLQTDCNGTNTAYSVVFEITGGAPGSYLVTGLNGNISAAAPFIFTSAPIPSGAAVGFTVSDSTDCPEYRDSLLIDCACATAAGSMSLTPRSICGPGTVATTYDTTGQFLDADDILEFVLHTNSGVSLGTILATNSVPSFDFGGAMQFGTTYYISAVVGSDDGSGHVLLADPCRRTAPGTPIIFHPIPSATLSGDGNVCPGSAVDLTVAFTGNGPWSFTLWDGTDSTAINGINSNPYVFPVTVNQSTLYDLISIKNNVCPGQTSGQAFIRVLSSPEISDYSIDCDDTFTFYTLQLMLAGGDTATYQVTGISGTLTGTVFTSDPIASGSGYNLEVTDGNGCQPAMLSNPAVDCGCLTQVGQMNTDMISLCGRGSITGIYDFRREDLDANDRVVFILHSDPADPFGSQIAQDSVPTFVFNMQTMNWEQVYYITAIAGNDNGNGGIQTQDPCLSISASTPIIFHRLPSGTLMGSQSICMGDRVNLPIQLFGTPPFSITIFDGVSSTMFNDIPAVYQFTSAPINTTTFNLIAVEDSLCSNFGNNSAVTITVNSAPQATVRRSAQVCNTDESGDSTTLDFSTLITSGDRTGIWLDLESTGATGIFPILDFSGVAPGMYRFSYTTASAIPPCEDKTYELVLTVRDCSCPSVETQGIGPLCNDDALLDLRNLQITTEPGFWTIISAPAGATAAITGSTFDGNGSVAGDYELLFTLTNTPSPLCQATSRQTISIQQAVSAGNISGAIRFCQDGTNLLDLNLELSGQSMGGTWTDKSTTPAPGNFDPNAGVLNLLNLPAGTYAFQYAVTGTTPCPSDSTTVVVEIDYPVSAGIVLDNPAFCESRDTLIQLWDLIQGNTPGGIWSDASSRPVQPGAFDPFAATFQPGNQQPGIYLFEYSITSQGGICADDSAQIEVLIHPNPIADAGGDKELTCETRLVRLGGNSSSGPNIRYLWSGNIPDPQTQYPEVGQPGSYGLIVTDLLTGCKASDTAAVAEKQNLPTLQANSIEITCFGDRDGVIEVENVLGGTPPFLYSLNGGAFTSENTFANLGPGNYTLEVEDSEGCTDNLSFTIFEPQELTVTLSVYLGNQSNVVQFGDSVQLNATVSGSFDSILWTPMEAFQPCDEEINLADCLNPWVKPESLTTYRVTVINEKGCSDSAEITLAVKKDRKVYIPSGFSPNGDGINDDFRIYTDGTVEKIESFLVFDRWGELIYEYYDFQPDDPAAGWDGTLKGQKMNSAVFAYFAKVRFIDGVTILYEGDVTLVR